jgi:hypothetical protein
MPVKIVDGAVNRVAMTVVNDGGYCALRFNARNGGPFNAGLEPVGARHGRAVVIQYNHQTSVEYIPARGYAGPDHFTIRLLANGEPDTTLHVDVTVVPVGAPIPAPATGGVRHGKP